MDRLTKLATEVTRKLSLLTDDQQYEYRCRLGDDWLWKGPEEEMPIMDAFLAEKGIAVPPRRS